MLKQVKIEKIVIGLICLVLSMSITLQVRTMASKDSTVSQTFRNDELKDKLLEWEEKYESMTKSLEESNKKLEEKRASASENDDSSKEKSERLKENNKLLGLTDVTGEGIIVTASDGQANISTDNVSSYLVHDGDLREIVNELSNAGAEAISINDQRIVNSTCIICVGNVISINGEKVGSPFIIKAIGNQERLYGINRPGGYISYMKDYTSVDIKKSNNISIKKFTGALTQKYIN